jgi:hypothetical protein
MTSLHIPVVPSQVQAALLAYLERAEDDESVLSLARSSHALPFWRDFGGALFLRPDGEVLASDWERPGYIELLADIRPNRDLLHAARGWATKELPSLDGLAPVRPPEAVPCLTCDGTGLIPKWTDRTPNLVCACGGLGWLPEPPAPIDRGTQAAAWEKFVATARSFPRRLFLWWHTPEA